MSFLNGYRTYIIAGVSLLLIVLHYLGIDIPGVNSAQVGDIGAIIALFFARIGSKNDAAKAVVVSSTTSAATVSAAKEQIKQVG